MGRQGQKNTLSPPAAKIPDRRDKPFPVDFRHALPNPIKHRALVFRQPAQTIDEENRQIYIR